MDIPVWVINVFIGLGGLTCTVLVIVMSRIAKANNVGREMGEVVTEIKYMRKDIQEGNENMATHLVFCRSQCKELSLLDKKVSKLHDRVDGHDTHLSRHDQELEDLRKLREERK